MIISLIHILLACVAILGLGFVVVGVRVKSMAGQLASIPKLDRKVSSTFAEHRRRLDGISDSVGFICERQADNAKAISEIREQREPPSLAPAHPDDLHPSEVQYWRERLAGLEQAALHYGLKLEYTLTIDPDA